MRSLRTSLPGCTDGGASTIGGLWPEPVSRAADCLYSVRLTIGGFWCLLALTAAGAAYGSPSEPREGSRQDGRFEDIYPSFDSVATPFFPLVPSGIVQPVLTAQDVTDIHANFVADPFVVCDGNRWYMFLEVLATVISARGMIGVAESPDGFVWDYNRIVLAESFHLSYPFVFRWEGDYYMVPESWHDHSVRLYKADPFPYVWTYQTSLLTGLGFADPTIFRHQDRWWMFVSDLTSANCYLYWSDSLDGGWMEHPASPIIHNDRQRARPAGPVVHREGVLYRQAMDCGPCYGYGVRVFAVDALTPTVYQEHEIPQSPILRGDGSGWNADAMHTCSPWYSNRGWLAAVDGAEDGVWSIGIYRHPDPPGLSGLTDGFGPRGVPDGGRPGRPTLLVSPCPAPRHVLLRFRPGDVAEREGRAGGTGDVELCVFDATGRPVLRRTLARKADCGGGWLWDTRDGGGRDVPCGAYTCILRQGGLTASGRVIVVR